MEIVPWVISNSKWLIDKGNRSFWMDKWWSEGILFDKLGVNRGTDLNVPICDVFHLRDLFIDDIGDDSLLVRHMWRDLSSLQVDSAGNDDKLIWMLSSSGLFSMQSAAVKLHFNCKKSRYARLLWSSLLPPKVSLFLWRVSWNGVAMDTNVHSKSIILVSKCNCCYQGQVETLEHLLFSSELASSLWCFFGGLLQVEVS